MTSLKKGDIAPDFTLPADSGQTITLSALKGERVVLYFYPKDDTPGCTKEACGFRDNLPALGKLGAKVIGISKDTPAKHDKFRDKYDLNFPLASDKDGKICEAYGIFKEKSMYGKTFMGIERTTFLIDPDGKIEEIWHKVKVDGHVEEIMERLQALPKAS